MPMQTAQTSSELANSHVCAAETVESMGITDAYLKNNILVTTMQIRKDLGIQIIDAQILSFYFYLFSVRNTIYTNTIIGFS